jgi:polysaccharide biosynthesis transport protein
MSSPEWPGDEAGPQYLSFFELYQNLLRVVLEHLFLIFTLLLLVVGSAFYYITTTKPLYESAVVLEVQRQEESQVKVESAQLEDLSSLDMVKTIEQSLQRISLFMKVLERPDIKAKPQVLEGLSSTDELNTEMQVAEMLADSTTVELRRGTRLIYVSVEHQVPEMAQLLANAIVDEFILERSGVKSGSTADASTFLTDQSAQLKQELQLAENAVQLYASAMAVRDRLNTHLAAIGVLQQRYRAKHPQMIQAQSLLISLRADLDGELAKIRLGNKDENTYWEGQQADWKLVEAGSDTLSYKLRSLEARFNVLSRELETVRQLYDSLIRQMRESMVSQKSDPTEIRIIESALLAQKPSKPKKMLIMLASVVLGLGAGVVLSVVLDALDQTLRTVDATERFTQLSVMTVLPKRKGLSKKRKLSLLLDPDSDLAEGMRTLRTALELKSRKQGWKLFLFTSSVPGEGKSFTSANMAVASAQQNLKTLLIDADLRRPVMEEFMPQVKNKPGLHDVLSGEVEVEKVIQLAEGTPHLYLLSAGSRCPNPAELLSETKIHQLLEKLKTQYDRIIIDSAPINAVSDTLLIVPSVDAVCLVIKASATPKRAVRRSLQLLEQSDAKVAGVVMNQVPRQGGIGSDPYHYHYSSSKGYGKVYGR